MLMNLSPRESSSRWPHHYWKQKKVPKFEVTQSNGAHICPRNPTWAQLMQGGRLSSYIPLLWRRHVTLVSILQTFLVDAGKHAAELAYDRPSPKLISFMRKHYGVLTTLIHVAFSVYTWQAEPPSAVRCRTVPCYPVLSLCSVLPLIIGWKIFWTISFDCTIFHCLI